MPTGRGPTQPRHYAVFRGQPMGCRAVPGVATLLAWTWLSQVSQFRRVCAFSIGRWGMGWHHIVGEWQARSETEVLWRRLVVASCLLLVLSTPALGQALEIGGSIGTAARGSEGALVRSPWYSWRRRSESSGYNWGLAKARAGTSTAVSRADGTADRRSPSGSSNDRRRPGRSSLEARTTTSVRARSCGHSWDWAWECRVTRCT
jgi:hypothetical protein